MSALGEARTHFEAGEFGKARDAAVVGLSQTPDDLELLRIAGRAGVETGADDASEQLRKVAESQPESAAAWRDLGDALATEGREAEAEAAFRKVLEIEPEDETALSALGHAAFQAGRRDDGVALLEQVTGRSNTASTLHISLVEMYRSLGKPDEAAAAARRIVEAEPDNLLAALDFGELSLQAGKPDDAAGAFRHLREEADQAEDETAALHGMVRAELARGDVERARDLAREAGAIDTVGRTTSVLAHLETEAGGDLPVAPDLARGQSMAFIQALELPPSRAEVEALLDATLGDLRTKLADGDARATEDRG